MKGGMEAMKKIKVVLCGLILVAICIYILQAKVFQSDNGRQIPKDARLVYEESTSPNKQYVTDCRLPAETDICAIFGGHLKT